MHNPNDRRTFLKLSAAASAAWLLPQWVTAQTALPPTEPQLEGPFYPPNVPRTPADFRVDDNNDLIWVNSKTAFARGVLFELSGRILNANGRPLRNIEVHLWQCDIHGRYHHPDDTHTQQLDQNFQGFGRAVSDGDGRYFFRTIKPVAYPGRTPHIHFKLKDADEPDLLTTQMYLAGEARNATDGIYQAIPVERRDTVTIALAPTQTVILGGQRRRITRGTFDIVLGNTPRLN